MAPASSVAMHKCGEAAENYFEEEASCDVGLAIDDVGFRAHTISRVCRSIQRPQRITSLQLLTSLYIVGFCRCPAALEPTSDPEIMSESASG